MTEMPEEIWAYKGIDSDNGSVDIWDFEPRVITEEEREKYHETKYRRIDDDIIILSRKELEDMLNNTENWDIFALFSGLRKGYMAAIDEILKKS